MCYRQIELIELALDGKAELEFRFHQPESASPELLRDPTGKIAGLLIRRHNAIGGAARVETQPLRDSLFKITLQISNLTSLACPERIARAEAMMYLLASTHAILGLRNGEFVSALDPPQQYEDLTSQCYNVGLYPVLVGEERNHSAMLASPVILYDYPKIAPESAGDLYDGTEISGLHPLCDNALDITTFDAIVARDMVSEKMTEGP